MCPLLLEGVPPVRGMRRDVTTGRFLHILSESPCRQAKAQRSYAGGASRKAMGEHSQDLWQFPCVRLLDYLVCQHQEVWGYREPKGFGRLEIDDKLKLH